MTHETPPQPEPRLRLTGEQIASIQPPVDDRWNCDWDEFREFEDVTDAARLPVSGEWEAEESVRRLVDWPGPNWSDVNSTVLLDYLRGALAEIDRLRLPVSGESEGLRKAAQAALDEWDVATKDWLEWFARGGKGFHQFPRAARNRLATALRSPSEAGIDVDAAYDRRERTADALAVHVGSMRAHDIVDDIIDAYEGRARLAHPDRRDRGAE